MSKPTAGVIPQLEPELVQAIAQNCWHGDIEKVATTSLRHVVAHGVSVTSRYGKAHELTEMVRMLDSIAPALRERIMALNCNSKAGAAYSATLRAGSERYALVIGRALASAAEGHNGIVVDDHEGVALNSVDPEWPDDAV